MTPGLAVCLAVLWLAAFALLTWGYPKGSPPHQSNRDTDR